MNEEIDALVLTARSRWLKIKNPSYSQAEGRRELFDRWGGRGEVSSTGRLNWSPPPETDP